MSAGKMHFLAAAVLCCCVFLAATNQAAVADSEDKSEEVGEIKSAAAHNESVSAEAGPPDSHEAMNNREINPKGRDKRSYEFLMGLVNNNSKYEVTRVDPSPDRPRQEWDSNVTASELLLELMVKIAAHPNHWEKVHKLLQKIDSDLLASKQLVHDLQTAAVKPEPAVALEKKQQVTRNRTGDEFNEWPRFDFDKDKVNTAPRQQKGAGYPKTFAYHRVTGRPLYLNKNPKAYIAVSVIAPKPINSRSNNNINNYNNNVNKEGDLSLEKELRQLKPWTHHQNLKNMASIRSRWVIQSGGGEYKQESVNNAP